MLRDELRVCAGINYYCYELEKNKIRLQVLGC
jgi:hypothetical protein